MEPETPGITIVAEATIPRINKITIFPGVTAITVRASLLSFKSGMPPEIAKAITKARIPNTPTPPEDTFALMDEKDRRKSTENQAHKCHTGNEGMLIEQVFDGVGKTHNADSGADNDRDQKQDTLFEFPKQAGDRADEPVIDAERHRHRSAGYARNDVRDADHDPFMIFPKIP